MEGSSKEERWRKTYWDSKGDSEDCERKCRGMRMDRLRGEGRLNRTVVFHGVITSRGE